MDLVYGANKNTMELEHREIMKWEGDVTGCCFQWLLGRAICLFKLFAPRQRISSIMGRLVCNCHAHMMKVMRADRDCAVNDGVCADNRDDYNGRRHNDGDDEQNGQ